MIFPECKFFSVPESESGLLSEGVSIHFKFLEWAQNEFFQINFWYLLYKNCVDVTHLFIYNYAQHINKKKTN